MTERNTELPTSADLMARQDTKHDIAENVAKEHPDTLPGEMLNLGFPS